MKNLYINNIVTKDWDNGHPSCTILPLGYNSKKGTTIKIRGKKEIEVRRSSRQERERGKKDFKARRNLRQERARGKKEIKVKRKPHSHLS